MDPYTATVTVTATVLITLPYLYIDIYKELRVDKITTNYLINPYKSYKYRRGVK